LCTCLRPHGYFILKRREEKRGGKGEKKAFFILEKRREKGKEEENSVSLHSVTRFPLNLSKAEDPSLLLEKEGEEKERGGRDIAHISHFFPAL